MAWPANEPCDGKKVKTRGRSFPEVKQPIMALDTPKTRMLAPGGREKERAMQVKALLLAAGLGTRLRPWTASIPKCLVPIGGRPLLDYWVDRLVEAGIRQARVNTHGHADLVRLYLRRIARGGAIQISESHEPVLLGSAGAIAANADYADDASTVVLICADNLSDVDLKTMISFHRGHGDPLTMLLFRAPHPRACGIAEMDAEGRIIEFVEKPEHPKSDLANAGVYIVSANAYREIARCQAFDLGFDVLPQFVGRMRGWLWSGYHRKISTHHALTMAQYEVHGLHPVPPAPGTIAKAKPAVFLDRDGTLIEDVPYLADPAKVKLVASAADSLRLLQAAGFACVVVTNQSAVGRGWIDENRLAEIHAEMRRQLAEGGVVLDGLYYCPLAPLGSDRNAIEHPDRKPGPGMLLRACVELGLDPFQSFMVGDMMSDVLAGHHASCRASILVQSGAGLSAADKQVAVSYHSVKDLPAAAEWILRGAT